MRRASSIRLLLPLFAASGVVACGCVATANEQPAQGTPHWAFVPPVKASGGFSIDALLAKERTARGLVAQAPAERSLWLRRVHLDLIGLPPTLEEQAAFAADVSPTARERVVESLLASPHYGERWGRHFMDIWRYSDWYGLGAQLRYSQKHLWHWRDWIVESLNHDKSYDRMILEMLAGDELAPEDQDMLRATGFLARSYYLFNRTSWLDDVVEHTSKAFLGLTMNCVKCHEHKFDPFKHEDYYAMRAIFEPYHVRLDAVPGQADLEKDGLPRAYDLHLNTPTYLHVKGDEKTPDKSRAIPPGVPAVFGSQLAVQPVALSLKASQPDQWPFVRENHVADAQREIRQAEQKLAEAHAKKTDATVPELKLRAARLRLQAIEERSVAANLALEVARAELAVAEAKPDKRKAAETALTKARENLAAGKGQPYRLTASLKALEGPDEKDATRLLPFPQTSTGRRLAFAKWITDRRNPLTARVLVNHVWLRHFGQPLVANVFDFGRQSKAPALQTLLDALAVEFMENGWSLKHLHRLMVLSDAYAMSSSNAHAASVNRERDPENAFLWRMNPVRMDSHALRDSLLHLAGMLDLSLGGPTIDPALEDKVTRRSLYLNQTRDESSRFMAVFDNANVLECYRRAESIVPQQALALMNGRVSLTAAAAIAQRIGNGTDERFVRTAFQMLPAVEPTDEELRACLEALTAFGGDKDGRAALIHTLLNHHDFITIR